MTYNVFDRTLNIAQLYSTLRTVASLHNPCYIVLDVYLHLCYYIIMSHGILMCP